MTIYEQDMVVFLHYIIETWSLQVKKFNMHSKTNHSADKTWTEKTTTEGDGNPGPAKDRHTYVAGLKRLNMTYNLPS